MMSNQLFDVILRVKANKLSELEKFGTFASIKLVENRAPEKAVRNRTSKSSSRGGDLIWMGRIHGLKDLSPSETAAYEKFKSTYKAGTKIDRKVCLGIAAQILKEKGLRETGKSPMISKLLKNGFFQVARK